MSTTEKIFRDPLYNYIGIDRARGKWLLDLIETREVQRLRRIHQLGVSHFTYPGAEHSRFSHTLGVLHLMQHAWRRIQAIGKDSPEVERAEHVLLAAALLHDIGHGPFSHLSKDLLQGDHEDWSCKIIEDPQSGSHQVLKDNDIPSEQVVAMIGKENRKRPPYQKVLLSSQLDVDRLDYLRRDSYFTGAGYGHFDWYRILASFFLYPDPERGKILVWPESAMYAIEEYIFSRFYMYNNVYYHKTTRGFEMVIHAAFRRARCLLQGGQYPNFLPPFAEFFSTRTPTVEQYLAIEDAILVYQMQVWEKHSDQILSDLARRFLVRDRLAPIDDPVPGTKINERELRRTWEETLRETIRKEGFDPDYYALRDDPTVSVYNPYVPEKEVPDPYYAIFISDGQQQPQEISTLLPRLKPVTGSLEKRSRYYVPHQCRETVKYLAASRKWG